MTVDSVVVTADPHDDEVVTDPAGYIPKEEQLRILDEAGVNLEQYYRQMYPNASYTDADDDVYECDKYGRDEMDVLDEMREAVDNLSRRVEDLEEGAPPPKVDNVTSQGTVVDNQPPMSTPQDNTPSPP
ncbi:hypothetical protein [Tortoise microvirus 25]|nr:hypothetical protein [Tortoise microvirus 25]